MRYRLHTLLIVLALGPPLLALGWWGYAAWKSAERERLERIDWIMPLLVEDDP